MAKKTQNNLQIKTISKRKTKRRDRKSQIHKRISQIYDSNCGIENPNPKIETQGRLKLKLGSIGRGERGLNESEIDLGKKMKDRAGRDSDQKREAAIDEKGAIGLAFF